MPNGDQYRYAASRFRALGEQYLRQATLLTGWQVSSHLGDGPVADAVVGALGRSAAHLSTAADDLGSLASECFRRSIVCDRFAVEFNRWKHSNVVGTPPPFPPHPWVSL